LSDFYDETSKALLRSVNDPDYTAPNYHILTRAEYDAAILIPQRYRTWTGSAVGEVDQATKDAIDAQLLSDARDALADELDNVEWQLRAFALAVLDEINLHAERITAILDAADGATSLATFKTAMAAIADIPARNIGQMKTAVRNKLGS